VGKMAWLRTLRSPLHSLALALPLTAGIALGAVPQQAAQMTTQDSTAVIDDPASAADPSRPLPDIPTLMHQVEAQQREAEAIQKKYLYHSVEAVQEVDGHGNAKKTVVNEYDVFWVNGVPVRRLLRKNGKELSDEEKKKEDESIDKESARARERRAKADAEGKQTSARGDDEVTVSRLLELGKFSNAHRVEWHGRDTIVVDYIGDPKAKTRNSFENAIRDMVGTIWVDEQDHAIARLEGHFVDNFKIGGGLLVNIHKGFSFSMEQARINNEVWFPAKVNANGSARILLFENVNGRVEVTDSDYRKFRTDSTIVSAGGQVPDAAKGPAAEAMPSAPK
jgi:hypothetical protein